MSLLHLRNGVILLFAAWAGCWAVAGAAWAQSLPGVAPPIVLSSDASVSLDKAFEAMPDPTGSATLHDILARKQDFVAFPKGFNRGYTDWPYWLRVTVIRQQAAAQRWYLEISPPFLDNVQLYIPDDREPTGYAMRQLGDTRKFDERWIQHPNFVFPIDLEADKPVTMYIRLKATGIMIINAELQTPERFISRALLAHQVLGAYHGAWLLVTIANVLFWITARPPGFHWWMMYLVADGLQTLAANGLAFPLLAPNHPAIAELIPGLALGLGLFSMTRFLITLFDIKQTFPVLARILLGVSWMGMLGAVLILFRLNVVVSPMLQLIGSVLLVLALVLSAHGILRRPDKAYYAYFWAFAVLNVSFAVILGRNLGLIAPSFFVNHLWQLNLLIHVLLTNYGIFLALSRARERAQQSETQLAAAKLNRQFVSMVSHELLTPLSTIRTGLTNMIRDHSGSEGGQARRHQRLLRATQRMRMLIDNYLAEGNIQTENFHPVRERIELNAWLPVMLEDSGWRAPRVMIEPAPEELWVAADPHLLRMAISNLIDNALKYSGRDTSVKVHTSASSGKAVIQVEDHGVGISPGDIARIFDPYFRSANRPAVYGAGLGLFIVKQIVELHGGAVTVTSEVGQGSTFTVSVVLLQADSLSRSALTEDRIHAPDRAPEPWSGR